MTLMKFEVAQHLAAGTWCAQGRQCVDLAATSGVKNHQFM